MRELWFRGHLEELRTTECVELLARTSVGRVAYCTENGPTVLPVNHALIADELVVRIAPSGETAEYLHNHQPRAAVSYQVDEFDDYTQSGWSVLVRGTARVTGTDDLIMRQDEPVPWPAGSYWLYVRIRPDRITGRRLLPA